MNNQKRLTKREMIEAMLDGKTLISIHSGEECFYSESNKCGPFVFRYADGDEETMSGGWDCGWAIKPEPTPPQPATRNQVLGFLANEKGVVVRMIEEAFTQEVFWQFPDYFAYGNTIENYRWARIDEHGVIGPEHAFLVDESGKMVE